MSDTETSIFSDASSTDVESFLSDESVQLLERDSGSSFQWRIEQLVSQIARCQQGV